MRNTMLERNKILLALLLAYVVLRGISSPFIKWASFFSANLFLSVAISSIILTFLFLFLSKGKIRFLNLKLYLLIFLSSFSSIMLFLMLKHLHAYELIILGAFVPIFVMINSYLFLHEKLDLNLIPISIILIFSYFLFHYDKISSFSIDPYIFLLLIVPYLFSLRFIYIKMAVKIYDIPVILFWSHLIGGALDLIFSFQYPLVLNFNVVVVGIINAFLLLSTWILAKILEKLNVIETAIINYGAIPGSSLIFSHLILNEIPSLNKVFAAIVMFAGASLPMLIRKILVVKLTSEDVLRITRYSTWNPIQKIVLIYKDLKYFEKNKASYERVRKSLENFVSKGIQIEIFFEDREDVVQRAKKFFGDLNVRLYAIKNSTPWGIVIVDHKKIIITIMEPELLILESKYKPFVDIFNTLYLHFKEKAREINIRK